MLDKGCQKRKVIEALRVWCGVKRNNWGLTTTTLCERDEISISVLTFRGWSIEKPCAIVKIRYGGVGRGWGGSKGWTFNTISRVFRTEKYSPCAFPPCTNLRHKKTIKKENWMGEQEASVLGRGGCRWQRSENQSRPRRRIGNESELSVSEATTRQRGIFARSLASVRADLWQVSAHTKHHQQRLQLTWDIREISQCSFVEVISSTLAESFWSWIRGIKSRERWMEIKKLLKLRKTHFHPAPATEICSQKLCLCKLGDATSGTNFTTSFSSSQWEEGTRRVPGKQQQKQRKIPFYSSSIGSFASTHIHITHEPEPIYRYFFPFHSLR